MARTKITVTELSRDGATDYPAGTTIDSALVSAGAYVDLDECPAEELLLIVANTAVSALDVTVKAGDKPLAPLAGQGDLVEEVAAETGVAIIDVSTSQRWAQSGSAAEDDYGVHIDFETGFTGSIIALRKARHA